MLKRLCPICDLEMKSAHYCKHCRSFVRTPIVRNVTYYLNESHSGRDYSDIVRDKQNQPARQPNRQQSAQPAKQPNQQPPARPVRQPIRQPVSASVPPQTAADRNQVPAGQADTKKQPNRKSSLFPLLFIVLAFGPTIYNLLINLLAWLIMMIKSWT